MDNQENDICCYCFKPVKNVNSTGFIRGKYMSWGDKNAKKCKNRCNHHVMHWECYQNNKSNIRCNKCFIKLSNYEVSTRKPSDIYKMSTWERKIIYGA